jgi:prolyl-tRNA synthetase
MAVIAEIYNDEKGLVWPESVAPFQYHLITHLNSKDDSEINDKILKMANEFYTKKEGEVLWDDRVGVSVGFKLKDADLMGCPTQIVISKRSLENGGFEVIDRKTGKSKIQGSLV